MSSELSRIELLRAAFSAPGSGVLVGIGDDAAVLAPSEDPLVWTIDAAVEGTHFRLDLLTIEDVGYRATMAAASDLAAMGADPIALLAALTLPAGFTDDDLRALAEGQRAAAAAIGAPVAGGNLAAGRELSITTTAIGRAPRPVRRSGARPGDALWLAGPVGLAGAGFRLLDRRIAAATEGARAAVLAWRRPTARIAAGRRIRAIATAAIDVSDGLARDLGHIARESGVRAVIDPNAVVSPALREAAHALGADPLELALHGGEDYALLIAAPANERLANERLETDGFTQIGHCAAPEPSKTWVEILNADGSTRPAGEGGFDHFARAPGV